MITYSRCIDSNLAPDARLGTHIKDFLYKPTALFRAVLCFTPSVTIADTIADLESLLQQWDLTSYNIEKKADNKSLSHTTNLAIENKKTFPLQVTSYYPRSIRKDY